MRRRLIEAEPVDILPELPTTVSGNVKGKQRAERVPSSSPPPAVSEHPDPKIELVELYMLATTLSTNTVTDSCTKGLIGLTSAMMNG